MYKIISIIFTGAFVAPALPVEPGTFSIVAYDAATREWGVAVASRVLAVGYIVPWARAGVGAVATQALANVSFGPDGLGMMAEGKSADETLAALLAADEDRERRQVGLVDRDGNAAAFTGAATNGWAGHIEGDGYVIQGNLLTGAEVLTEMERAYLGTEGPLARRLVAALAAGDAAGGDKRGKQSSALLVVREKGGYQGKTDRLVDIRVDDAAAPVAELARIYDLWEYNFMIDVYLDAPGEREKEYALDIIERVLAEKGDDAQAHNAVAWALATRRLYCEQAIRVARRAHELAPDDANVMDTVAEAYFAAGDAYSAAAWEKRALAREPDNDFFKKQLQRFNAACGPTR